MDNKILAITEKFRRKPDISRENAQLVADIRDTKARLDAAYERFEYESDSDLVSSVIYEIEALRAQYSYLLRLARSKGIACAEITVFKREA